MQFRYSGAILLSPIVNAVRSRNLASISKCVSAKCQNGVGESQEALELNVRSLLDLRELSIMVAMLEFKETDVNADGWWLIQVFLSRHLDCSGTE
jgi:hypothetical protein